MLFCNPRRKQHAALLYDCSEIIFVKISLCESISNSVSDHPVWNLKPRRRTLPHSELLCLLGRALGKLGGGVLCANL